jgi:hypothetical protein
MSIDLSTISSNLVFWVVAILVIIIFFGVIRFFFRHLLHFFFRGCGFILLIGVVIYILHILKVF